MWYKFKMNRILRLYGKWFKEITGEKVELDWCSDWFCLPSYPYKIWIAMLISDKNIETLPQFLKENFICKFSFDKIELFSFCFLHEVGHIMTDVFFDEKDGEYDKDTITIDEYRKLPKEWAADEWAIEYINKNAVKVWCWQKKIEKAYSKVTAKDLEKFIKSRKKL